LGASDARSGSDSAANDGGEDGSDGDGSDRDGADRDGADRDGSDGGVAETGVDAAIDAGSYTRFDMPSCSGVDGLVAGGTLVLHVVQGPRPLSDNCYGYQTDSLQGVNGVRFASPGAAGFVPSGDPVKNDFTTARGTFSSSTAAECRGDWVLSFRPRIGVPQGQLLSPIDAGAVEWIVQREIRIAQAQFCNGAFAERGAVTCTDTFRVQTVLEQGDP
jgi:hypothetical protein